MVKHSAPESCKVYTPLPLAQAMVSAIRDSDQDRWLEPSVGKGVFLRALQTQQVDSKRAVAIDLDEIPSEFDRAGKVMRGVDFLEWSASKRKRFDRIVGNPPFVAIHTLPPNLRQTALNVCDHSGQPIGLSANTWYAFLLRSVELLNEGGSLAFVLPSACEYADYCRPGREYVTKAFDRVDLIRSRRSLFENVQEGAVVLVCQNKGGNSQTFRRHEVDGLDAVIKRLHTLSKYQARKCPKSTVQLDGRTCLGDLLKISLGGVTGDAKYFVLSESRRRELKIPKCAVRPVVTKARHIRAAHLDDGAFNELRVSNAGIWLFDPPPALLSHPRVQEYLDLATENGGCARDRYKIKNREPWHKTPMPRRPDAFMSGMSTAGIWLCFNELPRLNATNTLYTVRFETAAVSARKYELALSLFTTGVQRQLRRCCRVYADGLRKYEPGQLSKLEVNVPNKIGNAKKLYETALNRLLLGDEMGCREIADTAFQLEGVIAAA